MRKLSLAVLLGVVAGLVLVPAADADHLNGIRATIANLDAGTLTADIYVTAYSEGTPFTTTDTANTNNSPDLYWGEGEASYSLTVYAVPPGATPIGSGVQRYRGAFSHTYSSIGPFTLRVVQDNCCAGNLTGDLTTEGYTGNPLDSPGGTPVTSGYVDYFSNTAVIDFSQVPALPRAVLWMVAGLLAVGGALIVWRGMA